MQAIGAHTPATKPTGFAVPIARSRFPSITFLISCRSRANLRLAGGPFSLCLHLRHYDVTRKCRATCYRIPESGGRANAWFACEIWNSGSANRCVKKIYDRWPVIHRCLHEKKSACIKISFGKRKRGKNFPLPILPRCAYFQDFSLDILFI